jgi:hypothetical protein
MVVFGFCPRLCSSAIRAFLFESFGLVVCVSLGIRGLLGMRLMGVFRGSSCNLLSLSRRATRSSNCCFNGSVNGSVNGSANGSAGRIERIY